uniref:Uncharacterized protein n=1 Tax=Arundo donax TaxID=35708 RepID=A0A0A9HEF0_ARUDO
MFLVREIRCSLFCSLCSRDFSLLCNECLASFPLWLQAWLLYQQGSLLDMVDASMEGYPEEEVRRYIRVGLACTHATPSSRPTMRQVVAMLSRPVALHELEMRPPSFAEHCGHRTTPTPQRAGPLVQASPKARWPAAAARSASFTYELAPR